MNSYRTAKEVKKGSTSPMKTPEKSRVPKKAPVFKQSNLKTALTKVTKSMAHTKSSGNIAFIEVPLNTIEGLDKIRRFVAFTTYKPVFGLVKSVYADFSASIQRLVRTKLMLKAFEALRNLKVESENNEILAELDEYESEICPEIDRGRKYYRKRLLERGINGIMSYYCQIIEINQVLDDFYEKKMMRKAFEKIYTSSKYDDVVESFIKVIHI
jgi:hypothetical protein